MIEQEYDGQKEVHFGWAWKQRLDDIEEKTTVRVTRRVQGWSGRDTIRGPRSTKVSAMKPRFKNEG